MTVLLVLISNSVLLWLEDIFCRYQCFEIYLTHFTMILKNIFPSSYNCYLKEGYSNQVYTCITYLLLCNKLPQLSTLKEHIIISQFLCVSSLAMAKLSWPSQSILKEINPEYSLEGLMLKLQYFSHLMQKKKRINSSEKTLMLGKIEGRRRRDDRGWDGWMASPTRWVWVWANSGSQIVKDRGAWHSAVPGVTKSQTQFNTTSLPVNVPSCVLPIWNWIVCFLRVCVYQVWEFFVYSKC